jgi:hypothetical protein
MTDRPIALPFPLPDGPELSAAYKDLHLAAHGDDETKAIIGDPALLPRPWDPPTCRKRQLRQELWKWLDEFVTWFNTEYVWDPAAGMIPPCWPQHPHLVHEIAVLADQRRRAGIDTSSNSLEEWHRYSVPAFLDRLRQRTKSNCDEHHQPWPARARFDRHGADSAVAERQVALRADCGCAPSSQHAAPRTLLVNQDPEGYRPEDW